MKNKVLIATGIFPPDIGGPATMLAHLARSLTERGFEVRVLTYTQKHENTKTRKHKSIYKVYSVNINSFLAKVKYFLKMFKLAKWANVIYVTDTYSVGRFARYIKKLLGKSYILRFTGDSAWEISRANEWITDYIVDFQDRKYNSKIEKLKNRRTKILLKADKIIVDSEFNKKLALKIGADESKVQVIYNSPPKEYKDLKVEKQNNLIVSIGRLVKRKRFDTLISIMEELLKINRNFKLIIGGCGPEEKKLRNMIKEKGLEKNIEIRKMSRKEVFMYLRKAGMFVLNTDYEGLSNTVLEAMVSDTPVITTDVGGNPELIKVGENGILVKYNDKEAFKDAILKLHKDSDLRGKFVYNSKRVLEKFKWSDVVEMTIKVIKDILNT